MSDRPPVGPTGDFPKGKLNAEDEGGLMIAVSEENGVIRIDFGKPVAWIGLDKPLAINLAVSILKRVGLKTDFMFEKNNDRT